MKGAIVNVLPTRRGNRRRGDHSLDADLEATVTETIYEGNTYRLYDPERDKVTRDGRLLDEADLDALAERAEQVGPPGLTPGGKSSSGDGSHSPRFTIRLDKTTAQAVLDRARSEGKPPAKLLRQIVTAHVGD
ncbi:MAG: hypothetical protein LBG60_12735 [Bifidobacteriaceae bacterium]|jgi:hypothetical protein|nr:hypothetical protein [Bifidobacteriaceae bacterium]